MTLQELSQLYWLNQEIERDKEGLEELKRRYRSLSGHDVTEMQSGSSANSSIERCIAEIDDLEMIISAKITQCMHERNRLERYIADIPDSLTRQIFTLRFINRLTWVQVARHIGGGNTADGVRMVCTRYVGKNKERH